jgi:hypothetical protein
VSLPRLTIFVEGEGDVGAVPQLVKRLIHQRSGFDALHLEAEPFKVRSLGALVKNDCADWKRWLGAAAKKRPFAGVLLVLDGDVDNVPPKWNAYVRRFGSTFCAYRVAAVLGDEAKQAGAGKHFSVAIVFAMKEFEAWIICGIEGIRGVDLAGGRGRVADLVQFPVGKDVEKIRGAKELLRSMIPAYQQSLDQAVLAAKLDADLAAQRSRSFRRLTSAISQLILAARDQKPVLSPMVNNSWPNT